MIELSSSDYTFDSFSVGKLVRLFMNGGKKNLVDVVFDKVFYSIHKRYDFRFILFDIISLFRRDYILEKRRRGRKFIFIPLAIDYVKRELLALKYLRNKIRLTSGSSLFDKIVSETLFLFFSRKLRSKDFENMQKLLKENIKFTHFRWKRKNRNRIKRFFSSNNTF